MIENLKNVFFLGIGGIGMSAIARYLNERNVKVSGYDRESTGLTKKLEAEGMTITYELRSESIPEYIDTVIYTPAIKEDQVEYQLLKSLGVPFLKRSQILKEILDRHQVIAVAGTHGKTSTSAILAHLLAENGLLACAFVGGVLQNYQSNYVSGKGDWIVVEADEYDRSFLRIFPDKAIIQAMDPDHLDIYGSAQEMIDSYRLFSLQIKTNGTLWVNQKLLNAELNSSWQLDLEKVNILLKSFGGGNLKYRIQKIGIDSRGRQCAEFVIDGEVKDFVFDMAGKHNLENALAAAAVAHELGVSRENIVKSLTSFKGIERRFEYVYRNDEVVIIDDYAHHPVEIVAAINAARLQHATKRLTVVFQPHLYSRTRDFKFEFASALDTADEVMIAPLYPAREKPIEGVDSQMLLSLMKMKKSQLVDKNTIVEKLEKSAPDVLLFLGAGDFNKEIKNIVKEVFER